MDRTNDRTPLLPESAKEQVAAVGSGGAGVPPAVFLPPGGALKIRSRRLPHWEIQEAVYFVTFRLADSLPTHALKKIVSRRADIPATATQMSRVLTGTERRKRDQLHAWRIEKTLDAGAGECFLRNAKVAGIVANALKEFDGARYRLFAWTVMPNHVHVLFQIIGKASLADIFHSWKSYSAKAANRILGRRGEFWQREYHDHLIRNMGQFDRAVLYVLENPKKARLKDWPWVWSWK
jgi:REP element-mobilizing transposase RayT